MWYQPQVWAQSLNNAVNTANEIKKSKTTSYECFQILFYAVHIMIGVIGILMFIYGIGFNPVSTYTIEFEKDTDHNAVFLTPAILSAITIAFSFTMVLQSMNQYKKILLGIYMALVFTTIVTCAVMWKKHMIITAQDTKVFEKMGQFKKQCLKDCTHHSLLVN